jgi:hypothetical protein
MRKFLMAVAAALVPEAGMTCTFLAPFEMTQMAGADLVLVGEVTAYQDLGTAWGTALVTVQVDEVLKGEAEGELQLVWNGGMAQGPHEARAKGRVLIGAFAGGRKPNEYSPDARLDLPAIGQPYCGEVWMLPATNSAIAEAREVLRQ